MKCNTNLIHVCSHICIREFLCREGTLTWHDGTIPDDEIWLKLGGDKGGGYFKMNFQIVNTQHRTPSTLHVHSHALKPVTHFPICMWHWTDSEVKCPTSVQ